MNPPPLLQLQNVCYAYEPGTPALQDISLCIAPGERIAVLGNNGAGKSTFFYCCNGVLQPQGGTLSLRGQTLGHSKKDLQSLREAVGLVFQDPDDQIIASTVEGEISFGPLNLGLTKPEVAERVEESLNAMGLCPLRTRPPHYLSGGEKKRVTIADILAMRPKLILFDEPTSSLDPQNTARLQEILKNLSQSGMALLVATHDIDFAWAWARRVLVFGGGALLADGPAEEVFADSALLQKAALRPPTLYAATLALCGAKGAQAPVSIPKTIEEFTQFTKEFFA